MSDIPIHPGEMLKDELDARGIAVESFAGMIDCGGQEIADIVEGRAPLTAPVALKIEAATGIKAYIWVNLQKDYDMETAHKDSKLMAALRKIRSTAAAL